MGIKTFSPRSAGLRGKTGFDFKEITKDYPEKSLTTPIRRTAARNNTGQITMRHVGGGHKRRFRIIDFKRTKLEVPAKVIAIEYDPNRTSRIALISYTDGEKAYIIAPVGLNVGDVVMSSDKADIKPTATRALSEIAASIGRRYGTSQVRVLGFADSRGDKNYNKELSAKRAQSVKKWLATNGGMGDTRVTIEPMGEAAPVASNATAEGRQENRRVEIAVIK